MQSPFPIRSCGVAIILGVNWVSTSIVSEASQNTKARRAVNFTAKRGIIQGGENPMGLQNPVVIYRAANNIEANLIKLKLHEAGIDAYVMEDDSMIASEGIIPGVLHPEVYVDQTTTDQAVAVIQEYEREARNNSAEDFEDAETESEK